MSTTSYLKKSDTKEKTWQLIDADGEILGRLASRIASILMGKNRPDYTPHVISPDAVVVVNAEKIRVKGENKPRQKLYKRFTYYPGGLNTENFSTVFAKKPDFVLRHAVRGMLPKNRLAAKMLKKLRVYKGDKHLQQAQKPKKIEAA